MLTPKTNFFSLFKTSKAIGLSKIKVCDAAHLTSILAFGQSKAATFGVKTLKNAQNKVFLPLSNHNHQPSRVEEVLIYVILFYENSEIKIFYIISFKNLKYGYNGYIYNNIKNLYLFLFQEALYA